MLLVRSEMTALSELPGWKISPESIEPWVYSRFLIYVSEQKKWLLKVMCVRSVGCCMKSTGSLSHNLIPTVMITLDEPQTAFWKKSSSESAYARHGVLSASKCEVMLYCTIKNRTITKVSNEYVYQRFIVLQLFAATSRNRRHPERPALLWRYFRGIYSHICSVWRHTRRTLKSSVKRFVLPVTILTCTVTLLMMKFARF
jgi:hypothetical protein